MRALSACGPLVLLLWSAAAHARADQALGTLERQALDDALEARGLAIDPAPDGKTIGQIHVFNHEVFSWRDSYFQLLNLFHRTTRESLVAREAIFKPGQPYRQEIIDETTRSLQDPDLTSVVVIVPVVAATPGAVDVLIVTRDVWSLRLNTNFVVEQGQLLALQASLSENNLFGWRKQASLVFDMDQGAIAVGPTYIDRNVAGTRLYFTSSARARFARRGGALEGSSSNTTLTYPLFSLASKWGASVGVSHFRGVLRGFQGNEIRLWDLEATPDVEERLPLVYRYRRFGTSASVTRQFGTRVIQRVSAGHGFSVVRPSFTPDYPEADPAVRAAFVREIFPRSERLSELSASWSMFTPRYFVYRDVDTFDLREDVRLGPRANAGLSRALRALGSEREFTGLSAGAGWSFGYLGGMQIVGLGWSGRVAEGVLDTQVYSAGFTLISPILLHRLRVFATAGATAVLDDKDRTSRLFLGSNNGLRGYLVNDIFGYSRALGHLEVRSMPVPLYALRLGAAAFYDVGDAAGTDQGTGSGVVRAVRGVMALRPKSSVGGGVRLLIPQLNTYVLRFDIAFPLNSTNKTRAGTFWWWAGFQQAF